MVGETFPSLKKKRNFSGDHRSGVKSQKPGEAFQCAHGKDAEPSTDWLTYKFDYTSRSLRNLRTRNKYKVN